MKRTAMQHTKMRRLMRALRVPHYAAVGIMESLWQLTAREAPGGDIGSLSDEDSTDWIGWDGDAGELIYGLVQSGWLDLNTRCRLIVHDWHEHSDDAVDNQLARAGKWYANGAPPRMRRLATKEREELCARFGFTAADADTRNAAEETMADAGSRNAVVDENAADAASRNAVVSEVQQLCARNATASALPEPVPVTTISKRLSTTTVSSTTSRIEEGPPVSSGSSSRVVEGIRTRRRRAAPPGTVVRFGIWELWARG